MSCTLREQDSAIDIMAAVSGGNRTEEKRMAEKVQPIGLKKLRKPGAQRKPEWNRPNVKAAARAAARAKAYDSMISSLPSDRNKEGYHKPGSTNRRNQA